MSNRSRFLYLCILAFILLPLCSCSQELIDQTPMYAAANALRFAENDSLSQFKGMFDSLAEANATEELLQSLKESGTSSAAHETCHFVTMGNGDVWLFRFSPVRDNEPWEITLIQKLSAQDAAVIKSLLG